MIQGMGWGRHIFLDPNPAQQQGGGFIPQITEEELQTKIRNIMRKNGGDADEAVGILLKDNAEIREKNRQAHKRLEEITKPKEGVLTVEGDEAKVILDLRKKGVDFKVLPTIVDEHSELKNFKQTQETKEIHSKAAQSLGWDNTILSDQLSLRKLHVEMKDETIKENDKVTVRSMPYVRPADNDKAALVPLGEFAEKNFPKPYLEMLKSTTGEGKETGNATGVEFIPQGSSEQGSGGSSNKKDPTKSYLDSSYKRLPFQQEAAK